MTPFWDRAMSGQLDLEHLMLPRQPLKLHLPAPTERELSAALNQCLQQRGHQNLPAIGLTGYPSRRPRQVSMMAMVTFIILVCRC